MIKNKNMLKVLSKKNNVVISVSKIHLRLKRNLLILRLKMFSNKMLRRFARHKGKYYYYYLNNFQQPIFLNIPEAPQKCHDGSEFYNQFIAFHNFFILLGQLYFFLIKRKRSFVKNISRK